MKNRELFNRTHAILTEAYLNDTLVSGDSCGCAVGNLVAANQGLKVRRIPFDDCVSWEKGHGGPWYNVINGFPALYDRGLGLAQIESTGYSVDEVRRIEHAFENASRIARRTEGKDYAYEGLVSVFEVLADIHELNFTDNDIPSSLFYENKFAVA